MGRIWSDEAKFRAWLEVETVSSEILAEDGIVPIEAAKAIRERGDFDIARIHAIEAEVKHDVIAFTTAVAEKIGPESRQRRRRHRPGPPDQTGLRHHQPGYRPSSFRSEKPRPRIP
jgi:hypothetical protein